MVTTHQTIQDRFQTAQQQCSHTLYGHPQLSMREELLVLAESAAQFDRRDRYGKGTLVSSLEDRVATLFGIPAALYLPSGTLAQPMALKIWAQEKGHHRFAMHPTCHIEIHEQQGYAALYGLERVLVGAPDAVPELDDFQAVDLPLDAIVLELPLREIGGQLPTWERLVAISQWARSQDIACHLDGARIWQCEAFYGRSLDQIAALFDSLYVSLYKDLGGISGAVLMGEPAFIEQAKVWARRAGGNTVTAYPSLLSAHWGLANNLPALSGAVQAAQWLAQWLNEQPATRTLPLIPHTSMFHIHFDLPLEQVLTRCTQYMQAHQIALLPMAHEKTPSGCWCEISLGWSVQQEPPDWWRGRLRELWAALLRP